MTKNDLRTLRAELQELSQLREQLSELEARLYSPQTEDDERLSAQVESHLLLRERYMSELQRLEAKQLECEKAIAPLSVQERLLIRCRYLQRLSWREVGEHLGLSRTRVHQIHSAALIALQK